MVEDDIRRVLDEFNSSFITDEFEPGIYNINDVSEALLSILQTEGYHNTIDIEVDNVSMETKLVVRAGIKAIRFDDKSIFSNISGFTTIWAHKSSIEYISQNFVNLGTTN